MPKERDDWDDEDEEDDPDYEDFAPGSSNDDDEDDLEFEVDDLKFEVDDKDPYRYLKTMVFKIFQTRKYSNYYIYEPKISNDTYIFYIKQTSDDTTVTSLEIYIGTEELNILSTKSGRPEVVEVLKISSISTNEKHSGKNLAILLLIYAISHLKLINKYKTIEYSILDDCSNRSVCIQNNIYHILGFVPRDHVSLFEHKNPSAITNSASSSESTRLAIEGPEKVAKLVEFPQRANAKLNNIIKKNKLHITENARKRDTLDDIRRGGGKKSYKRKIYKGKSHKRKSHKRKSHKRKSHKRNSHKRKIYKGKIYKGKSYKKKLNIL